MAQIRVVTAVPAKATGVNGDVALDKRQGLIYVKEAGIWRLIGELWLDKDKAQT